MPIMAARKPAARKKTTATRRKATTRKSQVRKPARGGLVQRGLLATALKVGEYHEKHGATVMSRKDAAILRYTHEGCPTCKGNGQIFTKGKDGSFTGSKPCPAQPTKARAGRLRVALSARFSGDKATGLCGVTCPCGWKEKPRYRDAKEATKALRTHERKKHGGKTVGGRWNAQVTEGAQPSARPAATAARKPNAEPVNTRESRQPLPPKTPAKDKPMPDYSNPDTPLTASKYAWSATLTRGPLKNGSNPSKDRTGSYTPPPGATVGTLLNGIRAVHAQECGMPVKDVVLVRYSLREK